MRWFIKLWVISCWFPDELTNKIIINIWNFSSVREENIWLFLDIWWTIGVKIFWLFIGTSKMVLWHRWLKHSFPPLSESKVLPLHFYTVTNKLQQFTTLIPMKALSIFPFPALQFSRQHHHKSKSINKNWKFSF